MSDAAIVDQCLAIIDERSMSAEARLLALSCATRQGRSIAWHGEQLGYSIDVVTAAHQEILRACVRRLDRPDTLVGDRHGDLDPGDEHIPTMIDHVSPLSTDLISETYAATAIGFSIGELRGVTIGQRRLARRGEVMPPPPAIYVAGQHAPIYSRDELRVWRGRWRMLVSIAGMPLRG